MCVLLSLATSGSAAACAQVSRHTPHPVAGCIKHVLCVAAAPLGVRVRVARLLSYYQLPAGPRLPVHSHAGASHQINQPTVGVGERRLDPLLVNGVQQGREDGPRGAQLVPASWAAAFLEMGLKWA